MLEDYYQVGRLLSISGLSIEVILDKRVRNLSSDFFLTTCGAFFVSGELKNVFNEVNSEASFIRAEVKYFSGKPVEEEYFLIHVDEKVSCFDYEQSEYSGKTMILNKVKAGELDNDYKVRGIKKLCIDELKTGGLDFLFVEGVIWIDPIVSETFVRKVESKKLLVRFDAVG
ncbi:imm11 family protein [Pseudomonas sp. NUPR-001]|uniref:imm11 family protein n=1 Tax=Pseudomonas sp. NUPR-001 TaxID=3416058 RepID=UPI003F9437E6